MHEVFTPSDEEIARASEAAPVEQAKAQGSGVVLDASGRMIDPAVTRAAHRVLGLASRARG